MKRITAAGGTLGLALIALVMGIVSITITYFVSVFWYWLGLWPIGALLRIGMLIEILVLVVTFIGLLIASATSLFQAPEEA